MSETQQSDPSQSRVEVEPFSSFLESVPAAVLLLDVAGRVRYMNRAAEDRIERPRDEMLGRELLSEIVPGAEGQALSEEYRSFLQSHPTEVRWNTTIRSASGNRPVSLAVRSYQGKGGRWGVLLIEDRAALVAESERRRKAERLAAVGELAAGAAHEVNNPLASIKGFAQLLSRETLDRGQHQALEIISQECSRVARVIDNLLEFSSQQAVVEHELIDVSAVTEVVLSLKRYALETSGIQIESDFDPQVCRVEGEKGALQRLILILLQHAEKSLCRHDGEKRLVVRTREANHGAVLYVCDTGPGVPRHHLPSVLESEGVLESGLGLNTADLIARELGGSFWIESGEGKGTTFTVRLPRAAAQRQVQLPRVIRPLQTSRDSSGVRVLVADDEPTLRLALAMFLGRHGYEVDQAEDVEQALKMFTSRDYDVAFVDVRMPGDGLALLARLDDLPDWHGHAILMTGDQTQPRIREELRGGRPHLIKPFDMMDAVRMIESVRREPRAVRQPGITTWTSS